MIRRIFIKIMKNVIEIKKQKILIVLDYTIADMLSNENLNSVVIELTENKHSLVFITQFYFAIPKE